MIDRDSRARQARPASVASAIGLSVGDVVRTSYSEGEHVVQRIWLYQPGEYMPYDAVTGIANVAVDEIVVSLDCAPAYLNGIVRRGERWLFARYDWPPFAAPGGTSTFDAINLRLKTAPPVIVFGRDEVFLVKASQAPRQLDLFAAQ